MHERTRLAARIGMQALCIGPSGAVMVINNKVCFSKLTWNSDATQKAASLRIVGNRELRSWKDGRCPRDAMTLLALLALSSEQPPSVRSTAASIRSLPPSLAAAICFT